MALATAVISFDISDLVGAGFDASKVRAWTTTNADNNRLLDTAANLVRVGDGKATVNNDGTGSFDVWVPGPDGNPTSWQQSFIFEYPLPGARGRTQATFGPYTISGSANLADLEAQQAIPPTYLSEVTGALSGYVDDAADSAAAAAASAASAYDISNISTSDGVVSTLVGNPDSDTAVALATSSAASVSTGQARARLFGAEGRNLAMFHGRLASRRTQRCSVVHVMDSWGEGCGVTNASMDGAAATTLLDSRFDIAFGRTLRARNPLGATEAVGGYYYAAFPYGDPYPPTVEWTITDADAPDSPDYTQVYQAGLGSKYALIPNGNYMTKAFPAATSFDIHYTKTPGGGSLFVYIDDLGTNVATFSTANATQAGGFIWNSGPLTPGAHTVKILAYGGPVGFDGAYAYNGDETGIKSVMSAKGGNTINSTRFGSMGESEGSIPSIAAQNPALVNIKLLTNDVANPGTDIALTKGQMTGLISEIRAACATRGNLNPSFVITVPLETSIASTITWDQVRQGMYEIAAADTGSPAGTSAVSVFDLSLFLPPYDDLTEYGCTANDGLHLNARGYQWWAEAFAGWLAP